MVRTVRDHLAELRKLGRDEFLRRHSTPVLVELAASTVQEAGDSLLQPLSGPLMRGTVEASGDLLSHAPQVSPDASVHPVIKRPGGAFKERIGIGRTANNDIVLPYPGVSKYHAFFTRAEGGWRLNDAASRNGTFAGPERLAEGTAQPLDDECMVRIGPHALLFLTPPALVAFLEAQTPVS